MCCTYILYSQKLDKYYTGYTCELIEDRLFKHLNHKSGFTAKAKDWKVVFLKYFNEKKEAMQLETKIKKAKSRKIIVQHILSDENECQSGSTDSS